MMKTAYGMIFSVAAAVLTSACAPVIVQTYPGEKKPLMQVAVVKRAISGSEFSATFIEYSTDRFDGTKKSLADGVAGFPSELHMEPGLYFITANCTTPFGYAYPSFGINVHGGMTYEIACSRVAQDQRMVQVYVLKEYPSTAAEK